MTELLQTLKMCEYYLNNYVGNTSKQYYIRLRKQTLVELLALQLREFKR